MNHGSFFSPTTLERLYGSRTQYNPITIPLNCVSKLFRSLLQCQMFTKLRTALSSSLCRSMAAVGSSGPERWNRIIGFLFSFHHLDPCGSAQKMLNKTHDFPRNIPHKKLSFWDQTHFGCPEWELQNHQGNGPPKLPGHMVFGCFWSPSTTCPPFPGCSQGHRWLSKVHARQRQRGHQQG